MKLVHNLVIKQYGICFKSYSQFHQRFFQTAPVSGNRRLHSLADYQNAQESGGNEEEGQEFYAGGSEQSGEVIVGGIHI